MHGQAQRIQLAAMILGAFSLFLAAPCSGQVQEPVSGNLSDRVKAAMHLRDFKLQQISAKPVPGRGIVDVPLTIDGRNIDVRLVSHSLRSPNFQLYSRGVGGVLTPVPAPAPTTYRGQIAGQPGSSA